MRILVLIVIGLLLYIIIGNIFRKKTISKSQDELGKMVRCLHCDLHILEREAIHSGDNYFCSQAHLEAEQKK
jgi:competence protein ComGC